MTNDDGQTRGPVVTRTGASAGGRRGTASGRDGARGAGPITTGSSLPLFPSDPGERGPTHSQPRAPLGVRRPTPAVPRLRPRAARREPDPTLSFESDRPIATARAATPVARLAAGLFDTVLLASLDAVVIMLTLRLTGLDLQSLSTLPVGPLVAFLALLNGGYVVVLTLAGGQTFGKMVFGVRVVDRAGRPVTTSVALVRALGYLVSVLPLGLGLVLMLFDTQRRALHDCLAGTRVLMVGGGLRKNSSLLGSGNRESGLGKDAAAAQRRPSQVPSPETRISTRETG